MLDITRLVCQILRISLKIYLNLGKNSIIMSFYDLLLNKIKNYLRYTKLHFFILKFKNPKYIKFIEQEIKFHKNFLVPGKLIFDLGANIGDKSHIFSFFTKKIILYEPEEILIDKLKLRFRKHNSIIITSKLITDTIGESKFYSIPGNESYSSIIENYNKDFNHLKNAEVITKKKITTTLNFEIEKYGIPSYIKIDCEGAENLILKNLDYKIDIISFEANLPKFLDNTLEIIDNLGNKFNYLFNIRKNEKFTFSFEKNVSLKVVKNFLISEPGTYEVFMFNE
jgi:FkbM family methyltransferase